MRMSQVRYSGVSEAMNTAHGCTAAFMLMNWHTDLYVSAVRRMPPAASEAICRHEVKCGSVTGSVRPGRWMSQRM